MDSESSVYNQGKPINPPAGHLAWTHRQVFIATLFIAGLLTSLWIFYRFRSSGIILLVGIILGTGMKPVLNWLTDRGVSSILSKALIFLLILGLIFSLLGLTLPIVLNQTTNLTTQFSEYYTDLRAMLVNSSSEIMRGIGLRLSARLDPENLVPPLQEESASQTGQGTTQDTVNLVASSFHSASLILNGILAFLAIFLIAFYWTIEGERVIRSLLLLIPANNREYLQEVITTIESKLGGFIMGQFLLCMVIGGLSLIAYLLIGLPNALILAIIAGILEAVPVVGPVLGAVPALAIAVTMSTEKVVLVLLATIIIQLLENNLLVPRVMNRAVGVHPFLTLLSLAVFYSIFGIGGALLAVPIAAIFQFLINRFVILPLREPPVATKGRDFSSYLQLQATELTKDMRLQNSKSEDEVGATSPYQEQIEALADELVQILKQQE